MNSPAQRFFAVIVGVGGYTSPRLGDLDATVSDAQGLRVILNDPSYCDYPMEQTFLLTREDASLDEFRARLDWLALNTNDASTVLIYFSGHGGYPAHAVSSQRYLFLRQTDPEHLPETALSTTEFAEALRRIPAGRLVVILDACYAGGAASLKGIVPASDQWIPGISIEAIEGLSKGKGRVVIASSSATQPSYVRPEGDTSLFTHFLLEALRGGAGVRQDGYIRILDIFHYVSEAVRARAPKQTPILKADDLDSNFPIAFDHGRNSPHAAASQENKSPLDTIREQIIAEPESGAAALGQYLATDGSQAHLRDEIDLIRVHLRESQRDLEASGSAQSRVERSRLIFLLLERCTRIERGTIVEGSSISDFISPQLVQTDANLTSQAQPSAPSVPTKPEFHITISAGNDVKNTQMANNITNNVNHYYDAAEEKPKRPLQQ